MKNIKYATLTLLILGFLQGNTISADQKINLVAKEGLYQFPFFDSPTAVWTYNGKNPGPILRSKEGETLVVQLLNNLKEPTSIHWHGLRIDNAMDGVPGVTQPPIDPGKSFIYRLKTEDAGTFWYHPHLNSSEQVERGLKGVLIVEESAPLPWSKDLVWLMDDWLFQRNGEIFPHFNTHHDLMHEGRWGNAVTINAESLPEYEVIPGERIRIRMINAANARVFLPYFNGLDSRVIAVDGRPVSEFFALDRFLLSPGNRIDLDITIPVDAGGKTYVVEDHFTRDIFPLARIKVTSEQPVETPSFVPKTAKDFLPPQLFEDKPVTKIWDLNAIRGGKFGIGWAMNNQLWPGADKVEFPLGLPQKITFKNSSTRLHPMHIHGAFFRVLERNGKPDVEPFTRDTVMVGREESVTIGLIPEHKGVWMAHCHILEHAEAGMMTTITVKKN